MKSAKDVAFLAIIVVLAALLGGSIVLSARVYARWSETIERAALIDQTASYRRLAEVVSVDTGRSSVLARPLDRGFGANTFVFLVDERTRILRQNPIIENGVVVGFEPAEALTLAELSPGAHLLLRLVVDEETSSLYAVNVTAGSPFVRP